MFGKLDNAQGPMLSHSRTEHLESMRLRVLLAGERDLTTILTRSIAQVWQKHVWSRGLLLWSCLPLTSSSKPMLWMLSSSNDAVMRATNRWGETAFPMEDFFLA